MIRKNTHDLKEKKKKKKKKKVLKGNIISVIMSYAGIKGSTSRKKTNITGQVRISH